MVMPRLPAPDLRVPEQQVAPARTCQTLTTFEEVGPYARQHRAPSEGAFHPDPHLVRQVLVRRELEGATDDVLDVSDDVQTWVGAVLLNADVTDVGRGVVNLHCSKRRECEGHQARLCV